MPQSLFSSSRAMGGIYRAIVVEPINEDEKRIGATVYIPSLHRQQMPFNIEGETPQLLEVNEETGEFVTTNGVAANGVKLVMRKQDYPFAPSVGWWARPQMETGDSVFIVFENGDSGHPIIVGKLGSQLPLQMMGTSGEADFSGSDNETIIFNFCKTALKFNNAAACGVLGNLWAETTTFDTGKEEAGNMKAKGFGIVQWTNYKNMPGGRRDQLVDFCQKNGYELTSIEGQLQFMKYELETTYTSVIPHLQSLPNTKDGAGKAAKYWADHYEVCAEEYKQKRIDQAQDVYWPKYKDVQGIIDINAVSVGASSAYGFIWPAPTSSGYYANWPNYNTRNKYHGGIDISVSKNEPIVAIADGVVKTSQYDNSSGYGNYIVILHTNGKVSLYAHLNQRKVGVGDTVKQGQTIGLAGNTSAKYSLAVHLHFELHRKWPWKHSPAYSDKNPNATNVNPLKYINPPSGNKKK